MEDSTRPVAEWITEFSRRLTRHRLNQDLTQAQLAREAGISLRTVARIEAGDAVQLESFLRAIVALGLGGVSPAGSRRCRRARFSNSSAAAKDASEPRAGARGSRPKTGAGRTTHDRSRSQTVGTPHRRGELE